MAETLYRFRGPFQTREEWLAAAVNELRPWFAEAGHPLPAKLRVTVGWPSVGVTRVVIGETWVPEVSGDHATEVFVNPAIEEPLAPQGILSILVHELVHAAGMHGHGKEFKALAVAVGLTGKMTATHMTEELTTSLTGMVRTVLGPFPHKALTPWAYVPQAVPGGKPGEVLPPIYRKPSDRPTKQKARYFKVTCTGDHGDDGVYTVRVVRKWIEKGLPTCPEGHPMEVTDLNYQPADETPEAA